MLSFLHPCLAFLALVLPQSGQATGKRSYDPRIDVNRLPRQGSARHYIAVSGNYVVTAPIQCAPGEIAIEIGPNAKAVIIDGNGFMLSGNQASSVSAVRALPTQPDRDYLELGALLVDGFAGDALSLDGVCELFVSYVSVRNVGGAGMRHQARGQTSGRRGHTSVQDSSFDACTTGLHMRSGILEVHGSTVQHCDTGMVVESEQFTIADCRISSSSIVGLVIDDSNAPPSVTPHKHHGHVTILKISGGGGGGGGGDGIVMRSSGAGPRVLDCDGVTVSNCSGNGLYLEQTGSGPGGGAQVTVRNSSFSSNGGSGVKRGGGSFTFDTSVFYTYSSTFSDNAQHGLDLDGTLSSVQSTDSTFDSNGLDGVHVVSPLSGIAPGSYLLRSGSASGNGQDGVSIVCAAGGGGGAGKAVMSSLSLDGNGRDGMHLVWARCSGGDVTLQGNLRHGIYAESSTLDLSGLSVSDSGSDGLRCDDGFVILDASALRSSGGHGFHLTSSCALKASDLTVTGSQLDGVHSVDGNVTLSRCNIGSSGQDGVDVSRAELVLEECVVSANGGSGVAHFVTGNDPPRITSLTSCTVSDNTVFGVACSGKATPKLRETCCRGNLLGGLSSRAAGGCTPVRAHVEQCTFESNGGTALDLQSLGGGSVARCVIAGSPTGLHAGDSSGACPGSGLSVTDNSITECGTGLAVEPNGKVLVVRNYVSSCTQAAFAVGQGNMFGPVVSTSIDLAQGSSPHSNYAP